MQKHLPDGAFLLCKRSVIVNLCYLKRFVGNPPMIEMTDGTQFNLSKKKAQDFEEKIDNLPAISTPCPVCYPCKEKCEKQALLCGKIIIEHNDD